MLFPQVFVGIFTPDPVLLAFTSHALRIYCAALVVLGVQVACQMTFISIGNAKASIAVAVMRKFVLLLPLIFIVPKLMAAKTTGVYLAEPIADVIAVVFTGFLFAVQFKKALKDLEPAAGIAGD